MTPKEKAKELINKFNFETKQSEIINDIILGDISVKFKEHQLKKCALILCDEFVNDWIIRFDELKQEQKLNITIDQMIEKSKTVKFWQQVKQEILNL